MPKLTFFLIRAHCFFILYCSHKKTLDKRGTKKKAAVVVVVVVVGSRDVLGAPFVSSARDFGIAASGLFSFCRVSSRLFAARALLRK